jgi:hypothetical protein
VRSDLLHIAQAERANVASNGSCASLAELISSNMLTMTRTNAKATVTLWNAPAQNST